MGEPTDRRWIGEAVDRYQRPLLSYAHWLLRDRDRAADAVADTFARLCAQRPGSLDGRLAPWLFTVCRTRAIDMMRKDRRMTALTDTHAATMTSRALLPGAGADAGATDDGPAMAAENADMHAAALAAIGELPVNQQEVVRLKFQHDLSYAQIADVTGLTATNVGYLLHTALRRLRQRLST